MLSNNIISERLIIRDMTQGDDKDVWEIWSNSENEKYMSDPVESLEEVTSICKNNENSDTNTNRFLTVVTLKDTGEVIGTCCFGVTKKKEKWGFGYSIKRESWGKGYATELVKAVIAFGCSLGVKDFVSGCAIENVASGKVMQKCGMHIDHKSSFKQPNTNIVYETHEYMLHVD